MTLISVDKEIRNCFENIQYFLKQFPSYIQFNYTHGGELMSNKIRVFHVPIKDNKRDYDKTEYETASRWNQQDRERIEATILEIKNNTTVDGEERVQTSQGEVIIEYKKSPDAYRTKRIEGFLADTGYRNPNKPSEAEEDENSSLSSHVEHSGLDRIFTLLQEIAPNFEKTHHLKILQNSLENIRCDLKLSDRFENIFIFTVLLRVIQVISEEFGQDDHSHTRIKNEAENIQSLYSDDDKKKIQEFLSKFNKLFKIES